MADWRDSLQDRAAVLPLLVSHNPPDNQLYYQPAVLPLLVRHNLPVGTKSQPLPPCQPPDERDKLPERGVLLLRGDQRSVLLQPSHLANLANLVNIANIANLTNLVNLANIVNIVRPVVLQPSHQGGTLSTRPL